MNQTALTAEVTFVRKPCYVKIFQHHCCIVKVAFIAVMQTSGWNDNLCESDM